MDVFPVEERDFYVRVVSNKGKGVAISLYKAIESLTSFNIRSSNLADSAGNYVFTFTLRVRISFPNWSFISLVTFFYLALFLIWCFPWTEKQVIEREMDISLPILKQWIASAFLNQGFDFETSTSL